MDIATTLMLLFDIAVKVVVLFAFLALCYSGVKLRRRFVPGSRYILSQVDLYLAIGDKEAARKAFLRLLRTEIASRRHLKKSDISRLVEKYGTYFETFDLHPDLSRFNNLPDK